MTDATASGPLRGIGAGLIGAVAFGLADVLAKLVFAAGADVLTLCLARGGFGILALFVWLRIGPVAKPHSARARWISLGLGLLFAGVIVGLFQAIALVEVPIAILTFFIYPLLTGLAAAALGIDRIGWRGMTAALVAFVGLALMIGAHPGSLALAGLAFAAGAAVLRTIILLTARGALQGVDARLTAWYTLLSSTAVFAIWALVTANWAPPVTSLGWWSLLGVSIGTAIGTLAMFVSTERIGPFRTALVMNLEPLIAVALSAPLLGEVITPLQGIGGAIMLAALVTFQVRR